MSKILIYSLTFQALATQQIQDNKEKEPIQEQTLSSSFIASSNYTVKILIQPNRIYEANTPLLAIYLNQEQTKKLMEKLDESTKQKMQEEGKKENNLALLIKTYHKIKIFETFIPSNVRSAIHIGNILFNYQHLYI